MKEYIIAEEEKKKYITNFKRDRNGSISVQFADGRIFEDVEYCPENIEKIVRVQEEQVKRGIDHYRVFKNRMNLSRIKTAISFAGTLGLSIGATMIPAVSEAVDSTHPLVVCLGIGALTVLGTIPAYAKLYRDIQVVDELDKLKYRDAHKSELDSMNDYYNSLAGIERSKKNWMRRSNNPFSVVNVDKYDIEDLEKIVENISNEKSLGFTYARIKK